MIGDISRSLFTRPVTERYPFEKRPAPERFRGQLVWDPEKCTGCKVCLRDCPADAIELKVVDKKAKRFVLRFHVDRCTYCAQCVVNCTFDCLDMSHEQWELAALEKDIFTVDYGKEEDIEFLLKKEGQLAPETEQA
jgi:formate hydrogenlyase subunit 6/NADH:ubiquinone oxidoreductase subunit I